jgi:hypothetical protein
MDFRQLGKCLDSETSDRLREIGERYRSAQPCPVQSLESENIAGVVEEAAEPGDGPAAVVRAGGVARGGLMVINGGRAGRTHAATGRPALPARLHLVMMSESEHHSTLANSPWKL